MAGSTRQDLLNNKSTINQMRNIIYHLQRIMKIKNLDAKNIISHYKQMGKNIGTTLTQEYQVNAITLDQILPEIYSKLFSSKVKCEKDQDHYLITQEKCPLCKYKISDVEIPGCYILIGVVEEILKNIGIQIINSSISKSKTFGDSICLHKYEIG